jgi:hypothetical protein
LSYRLLVDQSLMVFGIGVEQRINSWIDYQHHYFSTDVLVRKGGFALRLP